MQTHPNKEKKMMGQQQQEMVAGSSVLRHVIVMLTVAAVMAAMIVAMATPAFAQGQGRGNPGTQSCRSFFQDLGASPQEASFFCTPSRGSASL